MTIIGIGMVFFGLKLMKNSCAIIKDLPAFAAWFKAFNADTYVGVLKCAAIGCTVTTIVQSSSATLGITISLASQGIISYETAAALVPGENIGTTITAFLASLGTTTNARRAAYFHVMFNVIGVLWITQVFRLYIGVIEWIVGADAGMAVIVDGKDTFPHATAAIATVHSVFNIVNTLIFLPFVPLCVRFLIWAVPSKGFKEKPKLTDLDVLMLETPTLAIEQSHKEIQKMGDGCLKMLEWLRELRSQEQSDKILADRLKHREQILDNVQDEVAEFITHLLSGNIPHAVADGVRRQLRLADEYESVSDYVANLEKFDRKLKPDGQRFTEDHRKDLDELNALSIEYLTVVTGAMSVSNRKIYAKTDPQQKRIREAIKALRKKHMEELSKGEMPPVLTDAYMAALNAYSRVRDHIHAIAEEVSEQR